MELLDKAIEDIRTVVNDSLDVAPNSHVVFKGCNDHGYFSGKLPPGTHVARLRQDYEFFVKFDDWSKLGDLMLDQLKLDLEDLLENGDINKTSDPLLKAMDGAVKRGKEPVEVDIFAMHFYKSYHKRKDTIECTTYLLLFTNWNSYLD